MSDQLWIALIFPQRCCRFFPEGLNASRKGRIQDYKTMKEQISAHVKDLIRRIQDEEQDLQRRLDARIQLETG